MDCETIIEKAGSFGLYQKLLGLFLCVFIAPFVAFNNLTQFLLFLKPDYQCLNSNKDNFSNKDSTFDFWDEYFEPQIESQCELIHSNENITNCIDGYEYDYSLIYPTIVSENDWVCEDSWKLYFVHTIYWTGSMFGVLVMGHISDKYGRVPAIAICHLIGAIAGTITIFFSYNFIILLISRAFMGFVILSQGMFAVVLVMEYVGNDGRVIISTLFLVSFSITATCLPWIAYYLRNWRILAAITSLPLFIVPFICLFIPESLRWLVSKGKLSKAEETVKRMAKINGKTLIGEDSIIKEIKFQKNQSESISQMFAHKRLLRIFILTNILWMLLNTGYTGGSIYAANATDNPILMLSINAAIDVFATSLSNQFSNSYGRKFTTITSCFCAAFAYFTTAFIPSSLTYVQLGIVLIGRLTFTVGYNVQYIYAAEVYPTVIRSRGLAIRLTIGSIGDIMSPQIVRLSENGKTIPLLIFGLCAFISSLLMFNLPETLCKSSPETLENGNKIGIETKIRRPSTLGFICMIPLEVQPIPE